MRSNGVAVDVELLRPTKDVQAMGIEPGVCIPLHLIELEVEGMALVHSVTASPPIPSGDGHVVTGRFVTRYADNRVRVSLTDGTEFIATEVHPVWLPDYQTWVPAGNLKNGDILDAIHGPGTVACVSQLGQGAPVYNIEVHREHVYHVAATGVLVHNSNLVCGSLSPSNSITAQIPIKKSYI
ncbi:MAG: hypothetical protein FJ308_11445 [Planctomycetes bacterium]|nr:hypothetical protein [Planctomycetota bacterium]